MEPIELEPKYSGHDISGKCLKCLAEQKLDMCLRDLLTEKDINQISQQQYEALAAFLQSGDSDKLRVESERYLAEGKRVVLRIFYKDEKPQYELKIL
jgi:hypothetical protein